MWFEYFVGLSDETSRLKSIFLVFYGEKQGSGGFLARIGRTQRICAQKISRSYNLVIILCEVVIFRIRKHKLLSPFDIYRGFVTSVMIDIEILKFQPVFWKKSQTLSEKSKGCAMMRFKFWENFPDSTTDTLGVMVETLEKIRKIL